MKRTIAILLVLVMGLSLASCMPNLQKYAIKFADEKADISAIEGEVTDFKHFLSNLEMFSVKLSSEVYYAQGSSNNICISPISVCMALSIASECANGETREQILNALDVTYEELSAYSKYLYAISNKEYKFDSEADSDESFAHQSLFNSIWLDSGMKYDASCVNRLTSKYNCDVYAASFKDGTAEKMINQYIEYKTKGLIKDDIDFHKSTSFAIIDAVYINEVWNSLGRDLSMTLDKYGFANSDDSTSTISLMKSAYMPGRVHTERRFSSFFVKTANEYKLHFVVPNEGYKLSEVINPSTISKVISIDDYQAVDDVNMKNHYTRVFFPAFDVSYNGSLKGILEEKLGIVDLFDNKNCDFSNLSSSSVYCNEFNHICRLKVDASGMEGAAISTTPGAPTSPEPSEYENEYHDFVVDRAFGFVLTDPYGNILFSGVINQIN